MTPPVAALALAVALSACSAEDPVQEALQAQRRAKLAEPWVAAGGWTTEYEAALAEGRRSAKPVLAYFTRSYAH